MAALDFSVKRILQLACVAVLAMGSLHAAFAQTSAAKEVMAHEKMLLSTINCFIKNDFLRNVA